MPEITAYQKVRSNLVNINNCEDYFRITVFIPLLDCVIYDLNKRFYSQWNKIIKNANKSSFEKCNKVVRD